MFWRSITNNVEQLGFGNAILYLTGRLLESVSGSRIKIIRYAIAAQPVRAPEAKSMRPVAGVSIRLTDTSDPIVEQFPREQNVIEERFRAGAKCYVCETKGTFAGYIWLAYEAYEEDEVRCRYELKSPETCVWDFDVYVAPKYRMGRTFARLWNTANQHLSDEGIRWSFSRISTFNPHSIAAHKRLGMRKIHSVTFLCIGKWQITVMGMRPFVHFSASIPSRPRLRLTEPADL